MLKANSKKAKENLKAYILANVTGWEKDPKTAQEAAEIVAKDFYNFLGYNLPHMTPAKCWTLKEAGSYQNAFYEFASGLPGSLFDDVFLKNARAVVGSILEQTEAEQNKYTEEAAEKYFCALVWNHGGVSDAFYKLGKF